MNKIFSLTTKTFLLKELKTSITDKNISQIKTIKKKIYFLYEASEIKIKN